MRQPPREWIECPICGLHVSLTFESGTFWTHGPRENPCPASRSRPEDIWRAADLLTERQVEQLLTGQEP